MLLVFCSNWIELVSKKQKDFLKFVVDVSMLFMTSF